MSSIRREQGPGAKQLEFLVKGIQGKLGKVGWLHGDQYDGKTPVAYVAVIQEFGCPEKNIPARPMFRPTIVENEKEWRATALKGAEQILKGSATDYQLMSLLTEKAAGDLRKTISRIEEPPLAPATIRARLRRRSDKKTVGNLTKPLVDSGLMLATVANVVEDDSGQ